MSANFNKYENTLIHISVISKYVNGKKRNNRSMEKSLNYAIYLTKFKLLVVLETNKERKRQKLKIQKFLLYIKRINRKN